jgi:hypothetical protein
MGDLVFSILRQEVKLDSNVTVMSEVNAHTLSEQMNAIVHILCNLILETSYSDSDSFGAQRLATIK